MNAQKKNHTLESLLARRVPLDELAPELYFEAKEARISDSVIADLCNTTQIEINAYKHTHGLIGVTIPGYEYSSIHNRVNKNTRGLDKQEEETLTIVEGVREESVIPPNYEELQAQLAAVTLEKDNLEKTLLEKDQEIHRLNGEAYQLQEYLNQANQFIRQLEAENEQYQSFGNLPDMMLEEDNRMLSEQLASAKSIIKQIAALI